MNQLEKIHTNTPKNTHEGPRQHTRAPNIYRKTGPTNTNTSWTTDNRTHQKGTKQHAKGTKGRPKEPTTKVGNRTRASQLHRRTPGPLDGSSNDSSQCSSAAGSSLQDLLLLSSLFNIYNNHQRIRYILAKRPRSDTLTGSEYTLCPSHWRAYTRYFRELSLHQSRSRSM